MKAYYSIVSISSSSHLNERFNIGLLCVDDDQAFFHYSKTKFKILGRLFSKSARELALSTLNSIDKSVDDANALNEKKNQFFDSSKELNKLSSDYLNYLNRYNNNLIQFSAPKSIDLEINRDVFEKLFQKYIFKNEDEIYINLNLSHSLAFFEPYTKDRKYDVKHRYASVTIYYFTLEIPENYVIDYIPDNVIIEGEDYDVRIKYIKVNDRLLKYSLELDFNFITMKQERVHEIYDMSKPIKSAFNERVVLKKRNQ
jgi:hypothetical protein